MQKAPVHYVEDFSRMALYDFASLLRLHTCFMPPKGTHLYHVNATFTAHIAREFLLGFVLAVSVEALIASLLHPVRPGQHKSRNMLVNSPAYFQYQMI